MTEKTKRILETIAVQNGTTAENVEHEIMKAIQDAMASPDPHAQALWKQMCPDGKEPDLDHFLTFVSGLINAAAYEQKSKKSGQHFH